MLLQFSMTNHRSIKNKSVISMKATKGITPVMAIYGANAAGKSNVLHALMLMREMICGKYAKPLKGGKLPQEPFCFTREENVPTEFEVIYYYDGIKYAYGYSFNRECILKEYLYHWPKGREALIFSRENNNYQFDENIEQMILAKELLRIVFTLCAQMNGTVNRQKKHIYGL